MKVEWERYKIYEDGSQSPCSYGVITLGDKEYDVTITDHTRPWQKEDDIRFHRKVSHAYEISGIPFYIGSECFYDLGFENYPSLSSVGIDRNPSYDNMDYGFCYEGLAPEHTIEEVEHLVEDAFVKAFCFDYDEELAKYKAALDKKQRLMDEAVSYKELRDYELAHEESEITDEEER